MSKSKSDLITFLSQYVTPQRLATMDQVLENRTRYITIALEDIYQSHNTSAVLRTCECFGIQDVHIIENRNTYNLNPDVALGSSNWLNRIHYRDKDFNTLTAIDQLKRKGYRIVATSLSESAVSLEDFNLEKRKCALFFGTELTGLTENMLSHADEYLKIPVYGFTDSFNISVSAAIILHHLIIKLRKSNLAWNLSLDEKAEIKFGDLALDIP